MKQRLVLSLLAVMLAAGSSLPSVFAKEGEIYTSFTIQDTYLGSEVELILPESMPLTYNSSTNTLENYSKVSVRGHLDESQVVSIEVDKEIQYKNTEKPDVIVAGQVNFGVASEEDNTKLVDTWTKEEVDTQVEKNLSISVNRDDVEESGDYTSSIRYKAEIIGGDNGVLTTPAEPVEPSEPTEPSEPVEPSEPSEPSEPAEPAEPTEPAEPSEPSEPTEPSDQVESSNPVEPVIPDEPTNQTE